MFNDLFKKADSSRNIYCSIFYIQKLNYKDFIKVFGQPHRYSSEVTGDKKTRCYWLFELYDGTKFEFYYDRDDYTSKVMNKLGLQRMKSIDFEDINELIIKSSHDRIAIIASLLKSIFPSCESKNADTHLSIKIVFEGMK